MTSSHTQQKKNFHKLPQSWYFKFRRRHQTKTEETTQANKCLKRGKKISGKAILAAAGRIIPLGIIKTVVTNFPTEAVKFLKREMKIKENIQRTPK